MLYFLCVHWICQFGEEAYLSPTRLYQINYVFAIFVLYIAYKRFGNLGHPMKILLPFHNLKLTQVMMQDNHSPFKVPFAISFIKYKTLL
jgi:hypothetical protein